ncbi:MAG: hypothetical protein O7F73_06775 [Gammaproteobacteria bacterium]|nr:hypothetical protein [Gammaproteobacteria bacterium]
MSLYRFARMSALLGFAGKYRMKIFNMVAAAAFAFVTSWLYTDIASYLQTHYPQWVGAALVSKTLIVYAALFFLLWQLKPSDRASPPTMREAPAAESESDKPSRLDELAAKPKLTSRKDAILNK